MADKLTASTKLYLLVFVTFIFIIGIGVYGIVEMTKLNRNTQTLYADRVLPLQQLTKIRFSYTVGILSSAEQAQNARFTFGKAEKQIEQAEITITTNWKTYLATYLTPEEDRLARQTSVLMDQSTESIAKLKAILGKEDIKALDDFINKQLYTTASPLVAKISELIDLQVKVSGDIYKNNSAVYDTAIKDFSLLIIFSLLFAIPFSYYLIRNVKVLISDLRNSNDKILESENKYHSLVEYAGDSIFLLNEDTSLNDLNTSACELLGYSREEFFGLKFTDVFPPEELERRSLQWELLRKNKALLSERRLRRKDGIDVDVELNIRLLEGKGFMAIARDMTERKKAEEILRESEKKYRNLFENVQDVFFQTTLSGVVLDASPSVKNHTGFHREEVIGSPVAELYYSPADREKGLDLLKEKGEVEDYELSLKSRTGEPVFVSLNARLIPGPDGSNDHIDGVFRNITERKMAEESIRQSEANYRQLFKLSPAPMWVFDEETYKFKQVNQACINHYGYSEEEFVGMTIMDISQKVADFSTNGHRHIKKSGEVMDVETSSIPVVLNGERQILVIAIDVTEKNLYEQKLTRAAIKAQEDERYEIGGELHDNVCQILAASLLFSSMTKIYLPPEAKEMFDKTNEYINLATEEIRNLSHRLAPAFFDEATLGDAFSNLLTSFNPENKYEITLDFDDPARRHPLNRDLQLNLYRILQEQLRNISKHANATRITVEVSINCNKLQMRIADNGIGFDLGDNKGGIGFANMNRRVQLFAGQFTVYSAAQSGCEITVEIPLPGAN